MEKETQDLFEAIIAFIEGLFNAMGLSEHYHEFVDFIRSFADFF